MASTRAVLIIGGSGFVGTHLALRLRDQYKVFLTYHSHPIRIPGTTALPLAADNRNWAKRIAYAAKPDVVIYAAGRNHPSLAESDPRMSDHLHVGGPATLIEVTEMMQPRFIYLSSCHVFDGAKGNYRETDTALPASALGKSKLGGENFVRGRSLNYAVVRSSPLIGCGNGSSLSDFDRLRIALGRNRRIELSAGELHSFAPVSGLCEAVARLIESGPRNRVFHYAGLSKVSPHEWATRFAERFGYDPSLVAPARGAPSARKDYSLNSTQSIEQLKVQPLLLEECFDLIEKELVASP